MSRQDFAKNDEFRKRRDRSHAVFVLPGTMSFSFADYGIREVDGWNQLAISKENWMIEAKNDKKDVGN